MRKSEPIQWVFRVLFYVLGLFVMALGVAIAANSNLGISPVNSLPYVVSEVFHRDPGTCVTLVFCSYILMQIILLRREFKWINLLQIVFSTIFGYFVNFTKALVGDFAIPTYAGQLLMLAVSIVFIAVGVVLYIEVEMVPMPMEGLSLAIAGKTGIAFHNMEIIIDCVVVLAGVALSFVCLHKLVYIREGTVITAIITGKVMALVKKPLSPWSRWCASAARPWRRRDERKSALRGPDGQPASAPLRPVVPGPPRPGIYGPDLDLPGAGRGGGPHRLPPAGLGGGGGGTGWGCGARPSPTPSSCCMPCPGSARRRPA